MKKFSSYKLSSCAYSGAESYEKFCCRFLNLTSSLQINYSDVPSTRSSCVFSTTFDKIFARRIVWMDFFAYIQQPYRFILHVKVVWAPLARWKFSEFPLNNLHFLDLNIVAFGGNMCTFKLIAVPVVLKLFEYRFGGQLKKDTWLM